MCALLPLRFGSICLKMNKPCCSLGWKLPKSPQTCKSETEELAQPISRVSGGTGCGLRLSKEQLPRLSDTKGFGNGITRAIYGA